MAPRQNISYANLQKICLYDDLQKVVQYGKLAVGPARGPVKKKT